jgi:hypothetical protein
MLKSSEGLLRYVNPAGLVLRAPMASDVDGTYTPPRADERVLAELQ